MQAIYENKPQELYCRDSSIDGGTLGCRSHLHFQVELALIFDGHTRISVATEEYDACGGDAFIVFPNQIHTFQTLSREQYVLLKINPELVPEFMAQFTSFVPKKNLIKGVALDGELRSLIERISEEYHGSSPYKEAALRGYLLVFLSRLFSRLELVENQSGDYHVIGSIMNYCNENYQKPLSLSVLAKELHLNKYYVSHVMSSKLGIGFNDYVNSLRVSSACRLLAKTDDTVTMISETVGFNTLRTFNRAFAKQMGCTPTQYRRKKKRPTERRELKTEKA